MDHEAASRTSPSLSPGQERLVIAVDRAIYHIARRWLWVANGIAALLVGIPILAPYLMATGHQQAALWIYRTFHLICSQIPSHSFFLFGYQMGICERDTAIYSGTLILGLGYGMFGRRVRPLQWRYAFLLSVPMAIDGFSELFGWRQTTWELRVLTGSLFAMAVVWLTYPMLRIGFEGIERTLRLRFQRLAAEGRARAL
ncbi:MAG TPA: DUF2085 domain-containing protein [Thermomicrobiaceae bacterium]|nr:DUF2085 domain-containing protein [Thermomicrobiaceae bacterium]